MAKIDNEKLTAAKKTLRAEIEERRQQTFTPTDAVEGLRAEILDMGAVGYSIEEIEEKLKESLGLKQVPMTRVRKILREGMESRLAETPEAPAPPTEEPAEKSEETAEAKEPPVTEAAVQAVPGASRSIANTVSSVKASPAAAPGENTRPLPASPITSAATAVLPPRSAIAKKEEQRYGEKVSDGGG